MDHNVPEYGRQPEKLFPIWYFASWSADRCDKKYYAKLTVNVQKELKETMACYGIDFSVVKNFGELLFRGI